MSARDPRAVLASVLLAGVAAGCDVLLTEPAPSALELPLSFSLAVDSAAGAAKAFARVDHVYVLFARAETVTRDTVFPVVHEETGEIRVRFSLGEEERVDSLGVYAELRLGEAALFKGGRIVSFEAGSPTVAEVPIVPVPAKLIPSHELVTLEAVGDTAHLSSTVLFASGDTIPDLEGLWTSQNAEIVAVTSGGVAVARALGKTLLLVHLGEELEAGVEARVGPG